MARRNDVAEVELPETDEVVAPSEETTTAKEPKQKKEPARGELPEGYVTPIGLAKILTEKGLHTNKAGETVEVRPQMVYSYMKNAPESDPFPIETVSDSLGKERQALKADAGVEWWVRKNERAASRKANAAEKSEAKAKRAAEKAAAKEAEGEESVEATEAE